MFDAEPILKSMIGNIVTSVMIQFEVVFFGLSCVRHAVKPVSHKIVELIRKLMTLWPCSSNLLVFLSDKLDVCEYFSKQKHLSWRCVVCVFVWWCISHSEEPGGLWVMGRSFWIKLNVTFSIARFSQHIYWHKHWSYSEKW